MFKLIYIRDKKDPNWEKYHDQLSDMCKELDDQELALMSRTGYNLVYEPGTDYITIPKNGLIVCGLIDDVLAGMMCLRFYKETSTTSCGLNNLYIDPKYRRLGLASKLVREAKLQAKIEKCDYLLLRVVEGNTEATKLYEKNGFKVTSHAMHCKV